MLSALVLCFAADASADGFSVEQWHGAAQETSPLELLIFLLPIVLIFLGITGYFFHARKAERQAAERKYRDLYDHSPDMLLSVSFKTRTIVDCNQTMLEATGYARAELIDRAAIELFHPDCLETLEQAFRHFVINREIHDVELQLRRRDGSKLDVSWSATAVCDRNGAPLYCRSALRDISERKASEAAIAESRNLLLTIIDTAPIRVFWKDRELRYLGCNTAFARDGGMSHPEDVIGKDDFQMGWAAQAELYRADDRQVMESGMAKLSYDEPQTTPDGKTIWLRTSRMPLRNKQDETIGVLGIYEDITEHHQAEEKLRTLYTVVEQSPISVIVTDTNARIEYVNPHFTSVTGYSMADAAGQNPRILQSGLTPAETYQELWHEICGGQNWHGELVNKRKNGELYWEETHIAPVKNEDGDLTHFVGVKIDITRRKQSEHALRESEERFRFMLENSPIAVRIANIEKSQVVFANQRYAELIDSAPDQTVGIDPQQYYANPHEYAGIVERIGNGERVTNKLVELIIPGDRPRTKWALASYLMLEFQGEPAVLGWFYDITDRKTMEEQIQHLAHYDPLTDLPNRTLFTDRLNHALSAARREPIRLALMFIDLDKFKPINDTLGHDVGDVVLKEVARRILSCLRESDTVARIGGDEFIVLLPSIDNEHDAFRVAEKIRASLNLPFRHGSQLLSISSSTGIAIYPEHGNDDKQLIKNADIAMYHAKTCGRNNVKIYRPDMKDTD